VSNELERPKGSGKKWEEVGGNGRKGEEAVVTKLKELISSPA
jgi:hypothetical protein